MSHGNGFMLEKGINLQFFVLFSTMPLSYRDLRRGQAGMSRAMTGCDLGGGQGSTWRMIRFGGDAADVARVRKKLLPEMETLLPLLTVLGEN
jgi:hypothetical protein